MKRAEIENLLIKGETAKALALMLTVTKAMDLNDLESQLILLSGQYHELEKAQLLGIIASADYQLSSNRIKNALTVILKELPNDNTSQLSTHQAERILFLSANPKGTVQLRVDEELRKIKDLLAAATHRDSITLLSEPAVTMLAFTKALQQHQPTILHFSGHGLESGISIEDEQGEEMIFPTKGLELLFKNFKGRVHTVFLNACYSESQAKVMSQSDLYVIGMQDEMGDTPSIRFAQGFYQALGEGQEVPQAFQMGMVHVSTEAQFAAIPVLWHQGKKIS